MLIIRKEQLLIFSERIKSDIIQKCQDNNFIQILFINGFEKPMKGIPITFGTSKEDITLTTNEKGIIRYKSGTIYTDSITIQTFDNAHPVEWKINLPKNNGEYVIRLSIWATSYNRKENN